MSFGGSPLLGFCKALHPCLRVTYLATTAIKVSDYKTVFKLSLLCPGGCSLLDSPRNNLPTRTSGQTEEQRKHEEILLLTTSFPVLHNETITLPFSVGFFRSDWWWSNIWNEQ